MSGTQSTKPVQMPRAGLPHRMGRRTGVSTSRAHQAVTVHWQSASTGDNAVTTVGCVSAPASAQFGLVYNPG